MEEYQKVLDYLTKLERVDSFMRTGDVVPHPASDLLQNLLDNLKIIYKDLEKYKYALECLGSMEISQEHNIYVSDYSEFDTLKNFINLFSQLFEV